MAELSLKKLNTYLQSNKEPKYKERQIGDLTIKFRTRLTIQETASFIDSVVSNSYIDGNTPSALNVDVLFAIEYMSRCTNIPMPTTELDGKKVIDSQKAYDIFISLGLDKFYDTWVYGIRNYIDESIEYKNQELLAFYSRNFATEDAIETFSLAMRKGVEFINIAIGQLEKNGDKLSSILTEKNINKFLNGLQKTLLRATTKENKE